MRTLLEKKINYLETKRKLVDIMFFLTFGGAFIVTYIFNHLYGSGAGTGCFLVFSILGLIINDLNEHYWKPGRGGRIINIDRSGITMWNNYFITYKKGNYTNVPLVPWKMIAKYSSAIIQNESVFLIYLDMGAFNSHFTAYMLPKGFNENIKRNIKKYKSHIVLKANQVHSHEYHEFINAFSQYKSDSLDNSIISVSYSE